MYTATIRLIHTTPARDTKHSSYSMGTDTGDNYDSWNIQTLLG